MLLPDLFISLILAAFSRHPFLYKLTDPKMFRTPTNNNCVPRNTIMAANNIMRTMAVHSAHGLTQAHADHFLSIVSFTALCVKWLKERLLVLLLGQVTGYGSVWNAAGAQLLFLTMSASVQTTLSMGRAHPFRLTKVKTTRKGVSLLTGTHVLLSDRI